LLFPRNGGLVFFLFFLQGACAPKYAGVFALFEVFIACIPQDKKERERERAGW
jgi:hypothetical protein